MSKIINVYADESCHLPNDHINTMVIGAVWLPQENVKEVHEKIASLKKEFGLPNKFEIKWNKVSQSKIDFYLAVIDYFFQNENIHFRAIITNDKDKLDHKKIPNQDHDAWYYKMYFNMLKAILNKSFFYNIYIDIKDTRGGQKIKNLHEVSCNSLYDFNRQIIQKMQIVKSDEIASLQIADLLIGAIGYENRNLRENAGKIALINRIKEKTGYSLTRSTLVKEEKFNLFLWKPTEF